MKMRWWLLLSFLEMAHKLYCQDIIEECPVGWFGTECQYQTHCRTKCETDGDCMGNVCKIGWFGYKCQYQDMVSRFEVPYPKIPLSKWSNTNVSECIEDERIEEVHVYLKSTIYFTWLSLTVKNADLLDLFTIQLENGDKKWKCEKQLYTIRNNNTARIECQGRELVNKLTLKGKGVTSLCSIHVSKGRNLAIKQKVTLSLGMDTNASPDLVDGISDTTQLSSCTPITGSQNAPRKTWSLTFAEPVVASSIEIYYKGTMVDKSLLLIETLDGDKAVDFNETDSKDYINLFNVNGDPITQFKVTDAKKENVSNLITLCEVKVFGVCVPGKWGLNCNNTCDSKCNTSCNEIDGTCPDGCLGYSGDHACSKTCETAQWGVNCKKDCDKKCAFHACDNKNGECILGCNGFSDPPQCTEVCSDDSYGPNCLCTDGKQPFCPPEIPGQVTPIEPKPESCQGVNSTEERVVVKLARGLKVMCDTQTDGGGWIVIQRRFNGTVRFFRGWSEYRKGFGDYDMGEFYLGNENLFQLTSTGQYELKIDLKYNDKAYSLNYSSFQISNEREKYKLQIQTFFNDSIADELRVYHNGMPFSTFDNDNDRSVSSNCARDSAGAWWYNNCYEVNLNGFWNDTLFGHGLQWRSITGYDGGVTFTEMKIREVGSLI
ncbi:BgiBFReM1 [Biomphalaria glabrata]|nr:BgiBFReM1 [Biomphalaria glabrata]